MSQLMTDEVAQQARQLFEQLREPVRLLFFTQPHACGAGAGARAALAADRYLGGR